MQRVRGISGPSSKRAPSCVRTQSLWMHERMVDWKAEMMAKDERGGSGGTAGWEEVVRWCTMTVSIKRRKGTAASGMPGGGRWLGRDGRRWQRAMEQGALEATVRKAEA